MQVTFVCAVSLSSTQIPFGCMLIIFGGLPGTGKTTIAKALATKNAFTYVRVDEIENAISLHSEPKRKVGAGGYHVAFAISLSNLLLGTRLWQTASIR